MTASDGGPPGGDRVAAGSGDDAEVPPGQGLIRLAVGGTGLFVATAVVAAIRPEPLATAAAAVDVALFAVGCAAFLWAFAVAVSRSRTEEIAVTGVYFLAGSAPAPVQRVLLGALAVQVVTAFATAGARLYTSLAFGVLVPMFGLGMAGAWAARHGTFPPRSDDS